jgi:transposase
MVPVPTDGLKSTRSKFALPPWQDDDPDRLAFNAELGEDHVARLFERAVHDLDLAPLLASYSGKGRQAHRPDLLLRVVLFEMHCGRQSPSQWHADLREQIPLRWLARGLKPALSVLYDFRKRLEPFITGWHEQIVAAITRYRPDACDTATLDGTTIEANAARHKMARLETVEKRVEQLQQADAATEPTPPETRPAWMAATPAGRQRQQQRLEQAQGRLRQMHEQNNKRPKSKRLRLNQIRVSTTDPAAASGRDKHGVYRPLYTAQFLWSLNVPAILSFGVFAQSGDHGMLPIMVEKMLKQAGSKPQTLLADSAYTTPDDLSFCQLHGINLIGPWQANDFTKNRPAVKNPLQIPKTQFRFAKEQDAYLCPQGHTMPYEKNKYELRADGTYTAYRLYRCPGDICAACPLAKTCAKFPDKGRTIHRHRHQELIDEHCERMARPEVQKQYHQRGQGERPFADMKAHRNLRRLNGRGQWAANSQTGLAVITHNLVVLDAVKKTANVRVTAPKPRKIPA